jgi:hypothetical protein
MSKGPVYRFMDLSTRLVITTSFPFEDLRLRLEVSATVSILYLERQRDLPVLS